MIFFFVIAEYLDIMYDFSFGIVQDRKNIELSLPFTIKVIFY